MNCYGSFPLAESSNRLETQFFLIHTFVSMSFILVLIWNVFRHLCFCKSSSCGQVQLLLEPSFQSLQSIMISSFSSLYLCSVMYHLALNSVTECELLDRRTYDILYLTFSACKYAINTWESLIALLILH